MKRIVLFACYVSFLLLPIGTYGQKSGKEKIASIDDLPRHTYEIKGTVTEFYNDQGAFRSFAALVRADIEQDLAIYEIQDEKTLRGYYGTLLALDMMDGAYDKAMEKVYRIRELHDKAANRLTSGLVTEAIINTYRLAGPGGKPDKFVFMQCLSEAVDTLPWDIVQESIEELKGQMDILSENFIFGIIQGQFDPVVEKTGHLSNDIAARLILLRYVAAFQLPLKEQIVRVLEKYIAANRFEKEDIWQERNVILSDKDDLEPVLIAIWDTGIDISVYPGQVFINPGEEINGHDDDLNGFVDDVNGIAYNLQEEKTPEMLYPLGDAEERLPEMKKSIKGFMDIQTAVESPEAVALKKEIAGMQPEEVKLMFEDMTRIALYAHGTHVAGIAVEGNPYARIMVVRFTVDYHTIPIAPTMELSQKMARGYNEAIEYMQAHGVRVVNMSWGGAVRDTERDMEANGIGETAEERAHLAREMFDIEKEALYSAMKKASDILFVNAAGNENDNVAFEDYYPAAFELPNLLVVGAVDKAGDVTSFTSFGPTVDAYANGYEVESYLPGGDRLAASGTSASSPSVTNLAAKLLAIDPSLTPPEVISLIMRGADANREGLLLINPKRSLTLLRSGDKG
jgi:subtilisin family serine protease